MSTLRETLELNIETEEAEDLQKLYVSCIESPDFRQPFETCELEMRRTLSEWKVEPTRICPGLTTSQYRDLVKILVDGMLRTAESVLEYYARNTRCPEFKAEIEYIVDSIIPDCALALWQDVIHFRPSSTLLNGVFGLIDVGDVLRRLRAGTTLSAEHAILQVMQRRMARLDDSALPQQAPSSESDRELRAGSPSRLDAEDRFATRALREGVISRALEDFHTIRALAKEIGFGGPNGDKKLHKWKRDRGTWANRGSTSDQAAKIERFLIERKYAEPVSETRQELPASKQGPELHEVRMPYLVRR